MLKKMLSNKTLDLLANVVIVCSGLTFILSVFLATVVFDKVSPDSKLADEEMEMGAVFHVSDQHMEIFQDAVLLLNIIVDIKDIYKTDEDGDNASPGTIVDLFPVGSPAYGKGTVEFRIKTTSKDKMPNLANRTQTTIPLAFVREETFNDLVKSAVKFAIFGINTARIGAWLGVAFAIGCILAGVSILYLDKGKQTLVEEVHEDDEE